MPRRDRRRVAAVTEGARQVAAAGCKRRRRRRCASACSAHPGVCLNRSSVVQSAAGAAVDSAVIESLQRAAAWLLSPVLHAAEGAGSSWDRIRARARSLGRCSPLCRFLLRSGVGCVLTPIVSSVVDNRQLESHCLEVAAK